MGTRTFTIPPVRTGFRWRINPHHSAGMDTDANALAFGLFSDDPRVPAPVHADNYTTWAALFFPDVNPDLLARWCRFNAVYTVIENKQEALYETSGAGSAERLWGPRHFPRCWSETFPRRNGNRPNGGNSTA
ncbi:hypothetical protein ACIQV3_32815 [Streptomyces sp. NPDC099050]|uniref:hypothetical protein n=1 Tax=Streptomyces sp. NPDC099050 TaxID=3366100 RepID=UPI00382E63CB